jgi:ectoine hydroxylase-related dioxygenase (phytanoyl-CoA dioxygenase family)
VVVFDASTLHFGGANTVADNERVVFYFGFARNGVAAEFDGGVQIKSATQADVRTPVSLSDCCA